MKKDKTILGFDRIARVYDRLVALVYGKALRKAQTAFLPELDEPGRVLVLGGGTGWFLEELLCGCEVTEVVYLEASGEMMRLSQERLREKLPEKAESVVWVEEKWSPGLVEGKFDLICTHCFLDLFGPETLSAVVNDLSNGLQTRGIWYFSDFRRAKSWPMNWFSGLLIWTMYRFFRGLAGIDAGKLPDFEEEFLRVGLQTMRVEHWFGGMVEARLLKKGGKKEALRRELPGL